MKSPEQIMTEIERLKAIELQGILANYDKEKYPRQSPNEAAIIHYWNTKAERIKLEWVLKNEPVIAIYDINTIKEQT